MFYFSVVGRRLNKGERNLSFRRGEGCCGVRRFVVVIGSWSGGLVECYVGDVVGMNSLRGLEFLGGICRFFG